MVSIQGYQAINAIHFFSNTGSELCFDEIEKTTKQLKIIKLQVLIINRINVIYFLNSLLFYRLYFTLFLMLVLGFQRSWEKTALLYT